MLVAPVVIVIVIISPMTKEIFPYSSGFQCVVQDHQHHLGVY